METMTPQPPATATAIIREGGFWYWKLRNGRIQSVVNVRYWLARLGGECELEPAVDVMHEPDDLEFAQMMGWV